MPIAFDRNRFTEIVDNNDMWYEDEPRSEPTSDASYTTRTSAQLVYVLDKIFHSQSKCSDFSVEDVK